LLQEAFQHQLKEELILKPMNKTKHFITRSFMLPLSMPKTTDLMIELLRLLAVT
jgi:hypothetical protein